jgi:hypothetical protein
LTENLIFAFKQESESGIIDVDDDPTIVAAVIRYLYEFDYSDEDDKGDESDDGDEGGEGHVGVVGDVGDEGDLGDETDIPRMVFHVKVYALADKYDIPGLKALATAKFEKVARAEWNTADFPLSISAIYESTPLNDRGLRDVAVKLAATHSNILLKENEVFQNMTAKVAEFGKDLACELIKRPVIKYYECPNCEEIWEVTEELSPGRPFYCYYCGRRSCKWLKLD